MLIFLRIHWLKMSFGKRWKSHFRESKFKHFLGETPSLGLLWRLNFSSLRAYTLKIHALPPLVCCLLLLLNTTSVWFTTLYLTWWNVLPVDLDIFISVASWLFVEETSGSRYERCYIQLDLNYYLYLLAWLLTGLKRGTKNGNEPSEWENKRKKWEQKVI